MTVNSLIWMFVFLLASGCGDSSSNIGDPGKPVRVSGNDYIALVSVSEAIFANLGALLQLSSIELSAVRDNNKIELTSDQYPETTGKTPAILTKHPTETTKGEICLHRRLSVILLTGTGEINVNLSGDMNGEYVIRECNVPLVISDAANTPWEAITTKLFGADAAENEVVFNDGVLMSTHIVEELTLLYTGTYAEEIVDLITEQPRAWHVLANPQEGIICMNVNPVPGFEGYVSYFAANVTVDPNPPAGYITDDLEPVNHPVAYIPNCIFTESTWQAIWNQ